MAERTGELAPRAVKVIEADFIEAKTVKQQGGRVPSDLPVSLSLDMGARVGVMHISGELIRVVITKVNRKAADPLLYEFQGVICVQPIGSHGLRLQDFVEFKGCHVISWGHVDGNHSEFAGGVFVDVQKMWGETPPSGAGKVLPDITDIRQMGIGSMAKLLHCSKEEIWVIVREVNGQEPNAPRRYPYTFGFQGYVCAPPKSACGIQFQELVHFEGRHVLQVFP